MVDVRHSSHATLDGRLISDRSDTDHDQTASGYSRDPEAGYLAKLMKPSNPVARTKYKTALVSSEFPYILPGAGKLSSRLSPRLLLGDTVGVSQYNALLPIFQHSACPEIYMLVSFFPFLHISASYQVDMYD